MIPTPVAYAHSSIEAEKEFIGDDCRGYEGFAVRPVRVRERKQGGEGVAWMPSATARRIVHVQVADCYPISKGSHFRRAPLKRSEHPRRPFTACLSRDSACDYARFTWKPPSAHEIVSRMRRLQSWTTSGGKSSYLSPTEKSVMPAKVASMYGQSGFAVR